MRDQRQRKQINKNISCQQQQQQLSHSSHLKKTTETEDMREQNKKAQVKTTATTIRSHPTTLPPPKLSYKLTIFTYPIPPIICNNNNNTMGIEFLVHN